MKNKLNDMHEKQIEAGLSHLEKRSSERIPAELELNCFDSDNFGTATNLYN